MITINILLENYAINKKFETKPGLSIMIKHNENNILLDVGPDDKFIKNAITQDIDLKNINCLFLSHNHNDHTGGVNEFLKINDTADIYIMDNIHNKYYVKLLFFNIFIGTKLDYKYKTKIKQIENDLELPGKIHFLKNTVAKYIKPTFNKSLYKKYNGKIVNDDFTHEGILVLEDNNELVIFNSCSHNGILNIIETVKEKLPNKRIRSYVGGLHLHNPKTNENEKNDYLDYLIKELREMEIKLYIGHCTGKHSLHYLKKYLGDTINEINTGMEYNV